MLPLDKSLRQMLGTYVVLRRCVVINDEFHSKDILAYSRGKIKLPPRMNLRILNSLFGVVTCVPGM